MYDRLDWLSVNQLVIYHTVLQVFKIRKSQQPEYLFEILGKDNRNGHIIVTNTELFLAKKSFIYFLHFLSRICNDKREIVS